MLGPFREFLAVGAALQVARCIPWVLTSYKLEEITTVKELRSNVAKLFKIHEGLRNEGVRLLCALT